MRSDDWTPQLDSRLRELHSLGWGDYRISADLDINPGHVCRRRKRLGLLPNHQTREGLQEAREARMARQRHDLEESLLADATAIRERLWEEYELVVGGVEGPQRVTLDLPDAKATAELTAAIERLLKSHENLARIGSASSTDVAKSNLALMLAMLTEAVGVDDDQDDEDEGDAG